MKQTAALLGLALTVAPTMVAAGEFWVDPIHGKPSNDGSASAPWQSLQDVFDEGLVESRNWESLPYREGARLVPRNPGAPVKAGDIIYLRSGYYGDLRIQGFYNANDITIAAQPGHEPRFRSVRIRASSHWIVRGLSVSPEYAPSYEKVTLFHLDSHGWRGPVHDIVVEDCRLQSVEDSAGWSASDWDSLSCTGFLVEGENMTIRRNALRNVNTGIHMQAKRSLVEHNLVENFAGDGMTGTGDHTTFQYNTVKNCYDVNDHHDDGFQSWPPREADGSRGKRVGIVLRGNVIINYEDPNQPHRGALQGIGCFGGGYVDFVVENNVIITDHQHGITLTGATNSRIVNNTVLTPIDGRYGTARVTITAPEDSGLCKGCVVRNNLASAFNIDKKQGVVADHNLIVKNPTKFFIDAAAYDLHLKKGSPAVNAGSADMAPDIDIEGVPRPWGDRYDIGAYEYHEGGIEPAAVSHPIERLTTAQVEDGGDRASPDGAEGARDPAAMPPEPQPTGDAEADALDEAASSAHAERRDGVALGDLRSWGVLLLAAILLFVAWRIGR